MFFWKTNKNVKNALLSYDIMIKRININPVNLSIYSKIDFGKC